MDKKVQRDLHFSLHTHIYRFPSIPPIFNRMFQTFRKPILAIWSPPICEYSYRIARSCPKSRQSSRRRTDGLIPSIEEKNCNIQIEEKLSSNKWYNIFNFFHPPASYLHQSKTSGSFEIIIFCPAEEKYHQIKGEIFTSNEIGGA